MTHQCSNNAHTHTHIQATASRGSKWNLLHMSFNAWGQRRMLEFSSHCSLDSCHAPQSSMASFIIPYYPSSPSRSSSSSLRSSLPAHLALWPLRHCARWKRNKNACGNFAKKLQLTNCRDSGKCAGTYSNNTNKQQLSRNGRKKAEKKRNKLIKDALAHKRDNRNENEWLCCGAAYRSCCSFSNGATVVKARNADCKGDNILLMRCTRKAAATQRREEWKELRGTARKIDYTMLSVVVYTREGQCHEFEIKSLSRPLWA